MSFRKYALPLVGVVLIASMAILYVTRNSDWKWPQIDDIYRQEPLGPPDGRTLQTEQKDIYVTVSLSTSQFNSLLQLNQMFMARNPHLRVHLHNEPPGASSYEEWMELSAQGAASDIMLLDNSWVLPFAVKGYLKPVDSLMTGDFLSEQLAALTEPLRWNGYLWGVPRGANPYVVAWNRDMLLQLGFDEPPQAWEELQEEADMLLPEDGAGERYIVNWKDGDVYQYLQLAARYERGAEASISLAGLHASVGSLLDWLQSDDSRVLDAAHADTEVLGDYIVQNRLLSLVIPWGDYVRLPETARSKLSVEQENVLYPWLNGNSFVIGAASKTEADAMLWIQDMLDLPNQQFSYELSGLLPSRASLYGNLYRPSAESGDRPPAWWLDVLSSKSGDDRLVLPDPYWPQKQAGLLAPGEPATAYAEEPPREDG